MKTSQEIVNYLCQRIGQIYFRPLMYGGTGEGVGLALSIYHEMLAEIYEQQEAFTLAIRTRQAEENCEAFDFSRRYRERNPSASEQEIATYVVEQWRIVSKRLNLPIPYASLREAFRENERLRNKFLDEEQ